jgi:hypothetical protein
MSLEDGFDGVENLGGRLDEFGLSGVFSFKLLEEFLYHLLAPLSCVKNSVEGVQIQFVNNITKSVCQFKANF